jgi:hypothetical protein
VTPAGRRTEAVDAPQGETTVVAGPHSAPLWVYERAICTAAPGAYGELVIQIRNPDMTGASV